MAWGVGAVALMFALDLLVVEPYLAQRAKLVDLRAKDENEADAARRLQLRGAEVEGEMGRAAQRWDWAAIRRTPNGRCSAR